MAIYGSTKPSEYNVSNIHTKYHIIYGTNDNLVKPEVKITFYNSNVY